METAKFNDTYCIGIKIEGVKGEVQITKMNRKSFNYEGQVELIGKNKNVQRKGTAKFWKTSKDGKFDFYKDGSAVLTLTK